jgi:hypothetical protein
MAGSPGTAAEPRFSAIELQAIRAVFSSTLEPGATRREFQAAGLVP